jgi:L-alanine-DL-glutamate epimerase-like enolase superfamily enzyme
MFLVSSFGMDIAKEIDWENPVDLIDQILPKVYKRAQEITDYPELRLTFALNALVAVDNAAWMLHSQANGITTFDDMIPEAYKGGLPDRHEKLATVPLLSYNVSAEDIKKTVDDGFFFLKIKIGSDPEQDGDRAKMVEWDKQRLTEIHNIVKDVKTEYTECGHVTYYLDANGRYDTKERLMDFLDHAKAIGALERILLLEEPFPEEMKINVSDIPARIVADESAHSYKDALERIELGYGAIALKPIAKTASMSFKIAQLAIERDVPCFCADLTVNPILVDWNKNFAARLPALPGMKVGILECNGYQNYKNWDAMKSYHVNGTWCPIQDGMFILDDTFYNESGGIFTTPQHYLEMC